ncbi:hypothetical protein GF377_01050 [candidate division GN15 bacterium]|nr:hypothetical protein [candidate division GN15 bacterium]
MKTEMDAMQMDERQRYCWLLANRLALIVLGLVWLGMIAWEVYQGRAPWFLIAMVPAVALIRFAAYRLYLHRG